MGEEDKKGFVVKDKRIFSDGGEVRAEEEPAAKTAVKSAQEPANESANEASTASPEPDGQETEPDYLPEINFYNFIVSLSTTALFHFGDFADPGTNKAEKNLPAAKQIIDTLAMLKDKTTGNRDAQENDLIEGALYELRMRYVKETA
jgi:hypothetical protein